jgi:superfamily I DNA/RNA helicase
VDAHDPQSRKMVEIYQAYEDQCQREGVVDFAELMLRTYELMRDNAALREHYQHRFAHILVDEFQDTNRLQYAWLKMFAPPGTAQGVFAVGDDDQSIYAFRGAQVGNMADFEREYRVKQVIKLERNYRSFGNILDSANALISHNAKRLGKNLSTEAGPGEPVRVAEATSDLRRGPVAAGRGPATAPQRHAAQRDRHPLPQQCAEPRDGERAVQCRRALPGVWRPALLRAGRSQARAGLPAPGREPE